MGKYDVIVIGGGVAGICASISAARLGCKTALIHNRPVLGGNSSSEIRVPIAGADYNGRNRNAIESGIIEELRLECGFRNLEGNWAMWDILLWEWVKREVNIDLFLNTLALKAIMDSRNPDTIKAIKCLQISTYEEIILEGDIFIDASGDSIIALSAGADFRIGRESSKEFGESLAPELADNYVLPCSLQFHIRDVGYPVPFVPPSWAYDFPSDEDLPFREHNIFPFDTGFWWIEYGGTLDPIKDCEKIRDELLKILFGVWDHIKNHGDHGAENYILDWVGTIPGKRESFRILGDYILTQEDVQTGRYFPDSVAYGGWAIDLHEPLGIFAKTPPSFCVPVNIYSIPFRCLYSRNVRNLMMAGRNISASHVALGSTRVQATCAVIGQAVGTAAYICKKYKVTPRELYNNHIKELQQLLLKNDCYIIGVKNEDPKDLARNSSIKVSSSMVLEVTRSDGEITLDNIIAFKVPISSNYIDSISLLLKSNSERDEKIVLGIKEAIFRENFKPENSIKLIETEIPKGQNGWITFPINLENTQKKVYWIWISQNPKISICYMNEEFVGVESVYYERGEKKLPPDITPCFKLSPESTPYEGDNIINGVARPESWPNIWISDPNQGFPQWVELNLGDIKEISCINLTFDTNLNRPVGQRPGIKGAIPQCVRDYIVYFYDDKINNWIELLKVEGNYYRHRIHRFSPIFTDRLRIEIIATNGASTARIYEIRVY